MKIFFCALMISLPSLALQTFSQPCRTAGDDVLKFNLEIEDLKLSKQSKLNLKIVAFEDEQCKTPYLNYNQYFKIEKLENEKINLQVQRITYTALSDEIADALNTIHFCQISNWKSLTEVDVSGAHCEDLVQLQKSALFFQLIRMNQNEVLWGSTSQNLDGRTETKRPVQFDIPYEVSNFATPR